MSTQVETKEKIETNGKVGAQLPPFSQNGQGMQKEPITKYRPFPPVPLRDRTWPDKQITKAPIWCSVDLRDGNQALAIPMSVEEKLEMFQTLVEVGFKEIEIGFPSASQIEFDFCRRLIEEELIPDDVTVQVLVQAREELIRRSFEALQGARRAIVHLYNSTNPAQRRIVFGLSRDQIRDIAVRGARLIKQLASERPETEWVLEYSPESFVLTELDFSLEICEAVSEVWEPTPQKKIIINLPTTVESCTPNVHADQIEWFCRNLKNRDASIISLHTHNDRGTGVATTELALMAGAERVEGTLFGNGERTGNLDVVIVALNMYTQGVDPKLDFSDLPRIREVYERCTRMEVPERQPYAGDLVFTAFSGSHQDAINKGFTAQAVSDSAAAEEQICRAAARDKGLQAQAHSPGALWEVPYLPLDPKDIGRTYEAIIRYNSQSGKGGMAFLLEQNYGFNLPKEMRVEFGKIVNRLADNLGREVSSDEIFAFFQQEYLTQTGPYALESFRSVEGENGVHCEAKLLVNGGAHNVSGHGNGPIDAFVVALRPLASLDVKSYAEHSLTSGAEAKAVSYIEIEAEGKRFFGAGIDTSIERASIKAVLSALNRAKKEQ